MDNLEKNKQIATRYFEEFWNKGNTAIVDELCAPNIHVWAPLVGDYNGREEVKVFIAPLHDAIEGYHFDMTAPLIAEGDWEASAGKTYIASD
jgi:hypothetical protein